MLLGYILKGWILTKWLQDQPSCFAVSFGDETSYLFGQQMIY